MTASSPNEKVRAVVLSTLLVSSVFVASITFSASTVAAANTAGNIDLSVNAAGNQATVTVQDADLNTDGSTQQAVIVNVRSTSESLTASSQTPVDTQAGNTQTVDVGDVSRVGDRNNDDQISKADFTLTGANDESILSVATNVGNVEVTISDAGGSTTDDSSETVTYQELTGDATNADTDNGGPTSVTTSSPVGDRTGDGRVTSADVELLAAANDESITGFTHNPDGTATVTISDSGSNGDSNPEYFTFLPVETVTLTETGPDTSTFTGTISIAQSDSNGVLQGQDGDTVTATYWDDGTTQRVSTVTLSVTDTTSPSISTVQLREGNSDDVKIEFESDDLLGSNAGDISVTVDGPNTANVYLFDATDFTKFQLQNGNYWYQLSTTQTYDDGEGIYTVSVDDAKDSSGNNGGNNGDGSGLTAQYQYVDASVVSKSFSIVDGPGNDNQLTFNAAYSYGMVQIDVKDGGSYDLDTAGVTKSTTFKMTVTVDGEKPRALIGNAHDTSWTRTDNGDGTWTVEITAKPATTNYYFDGSGNPPNAWDGTVQANIHSDVSMSLATSSMSMLSSQPQNRMDGIIFMTDAQSFAPPRYVTSGSNDKIEFDVSAPHFAKDGSLNQGFAEVFLPDSMLSYWGVTADGVSGEYQGQSRTTTITEKTGGALAEMAIHYSSGTAAFSVDSTAPTADAGSDTSATAGTSVTLDASASADNVGVDTYEWDLDGDGNFDDATGATVTHTYGSTGTKTVTVKATDAAGNSATDTVTVDVTSSGGSSGGSNPGSSGGSSATITTETVEEATAATTEPPEATPQSSTETTQPSSTTATATAMPEEIARPDTPTGTETATHENTSAGDTPGFGVQSVLVALAAVALVVLRRSN